MPSPPNEECVMPPLRKTSRRQTKRFAKNDKCVAIGEIGLDYYWMDSSKEEQKKFFKVQIDLAKKLDMPIIVHPNLRN